MNYTCFWIDVWDRGLVVPDPFLLCFENRLNGEWAEEKEVLIWSSRLTGAVRETRESSKLPLTSQTKLYLLDLSDWKGGRGRPNM